MSKSINLQSINPKTFELLSTFNEADTIVYAITEDHRDKVKKLKAEKEDILTKRAEAIEKGMSLDDAIHAYSIESVDSRLRAEDTRFKDVVAPYKKHYNECIKWVDDTTYDAYKKAMGEKVECEMSLTTATIKFLEAMGIEASENGKTSKIADYILSYAKGGRKARRKDREEGRKVSIRSKKEFKELWILAFIDYAVNVKGCYKVIDNGALEMTTYDEKTA